MYHDPLVSSVSSLENLSEDQKLLAESGAGVLAAGAYAGPAVVATIEDDLEMAESGEAEYAIDLEREWIAAECAVMVSGVLVDVNGREQRASERISLKDEQPNRLSVAIPKRYFEVGEDIRVVATVTDQEGDAVEASSSLVAMKLTSSPNQSMAYYPAQYLYQNQLAISSWDYGWNRAYPHRWHRRLRSARALPARFRRWVPAQTAKPVDRSMVTAAAFHGDTASLRLDEPGAYKLVAVANLADGSTLREEIGCLVREPEAEPGLLLQLNSRECEAGGVVKGDLHSRFADANVLLTLRDGRGLRMWKPIHMQGSTHALSLRLPEGLSYGCALGVQYVDGEGMVHLDTEYLRVAPTDRMLTIEAKMEEVVEPGQTVKIDFQVNRREPVDLVVSVYDQSLLGIAPDRSVDIRSFYLADERVRRQTAREALRQKLRGVTVEQLVQDAREMLGKEKALKNTPEGQRLQQLISRFSGSYVYAYDIETLLHLAGVNTACSFRYSGWNWHARWDRKQKGRDLLDLMDQRHGQWQLTYCMFNDTLLLAETSKNAAHVRMAQFGGYWPGARYRARGDSHYSISANSMFSYMPSGQSFISHLPMGGPESMTMLSPEAGEGTVLVRRDFSDSAFFNARIRTDEAGKATVEFKLPDSLTNWQVVATAVSKDMHVGTQKAKFRTFKPVMVWPMLSRVFTEGDKVDIYASVHNRTDKDQKVTVAIKVKNGQVRSPVKRQVVVPAKSNVPVYWTFEPGEPGFTQILMTADCAAGSDASLKRLPVVACAVEEVITASGFAKEAASFRVPENVDLRYAMLEVSLTPSLAADMTDTLTYLVQYPHGCVEQTMSRFLPTIKVAQILEKYGIENRDLEQKLPKYAAAGIKRLLQLQHQDGGWGWHGNGKTNEMITPYALYGLMEAEKAGYALADEQAINRGLNRLDQFVRSMGEKQAADRIYCMYVLSHRRKLRKEWWDWVADMLKKEKLSDYALALALEMAAKDEAHGKLAKGLATALRARAQESNGRVRWRTANFSRWGNDPHEITAAALKALVAYDSDDKLIPGVLDYFNATRRGNRWNSTKDTAMILYALCDYLATQDCRPLAEGQAIVQLNDEKTHEVAFEKGLVKKLRIEGAKLRHGENRLRFLQSSAGTMYRLVVRYSNRGQEIRPSAKGIKVARHFWLLGEGGKRVKELKSGDEVPRGAYLESEVRASHALGQSMRYVLVSNAKPSGCETLPKNDARYDQSSTQYVLREDKTAAVLWHHEATGNSLADRCVFHAELAGRYVVPPAAVELMYETETRGHSGAFQFAVVDGGAGEKTAMVWGE